MQPIHPLEQFLNLSVVLTGFNKVELQAAGVGREYLNLLIEMAGDTLCFELWAETQAIYAQHAGHAARLEREVNQRILKSAKYAPLARNIILLWYNAIWYQLPPDWTRWRWRATSFCCGTTPSGINCLPIGPRRTEPTRWTRTTWFPPRPTPKRSSGGPSALTRRQPSRRVSVHGRCRRKERRPRPRAPRRKRCGEAKHESTESGSLGHAAPGTLRCRDRGRGNRGRADCETPGRQRQSCADSRSRAIHQRHAGRLPVLRGEFLHGAGQESQLSVPGEPQRAHVADRDRAAAIRQQLRSRQGRDDHALSGDLAAHVPQRFSDEVAVRRGRRLAHRVRRPVGLLPAGRTGHGRIGRRGRPGLPRHPLPEGLRLPDAQGTPELPGPGDLAQPQRHAIQVRAKDLRYLAHQRAAGP